MKLRRRSTVAAEFKFSTSSRKINSKNTIQHIFVVIGTVTVLSISFIKIIQRLNQTKNDIQYFEMTNSSEVFHHLDYINPLAGWKKGFLPIDSIHRKGKIHQGSWIFVIDTTITYATTSSNLPRVLLLKRANHLITCPNTWSLLGEHTFRDEKPIETVKRGIKEEFGIKAFDYIERNGRISNLTEYPLYYERDYGMSNGGRIDRQITYLWLVEMNYTAITRTTTTTTTAAAEESSIVSDDHHYSIKNSGVDDLLEFDDEVADHKWIFLDMFLAFNPLKEYFTPPDRDEEKLSFCHETIVSLTKFGMERLRILKDSTT